MAKAEIIPWTYWSFDYLSGRIPRAPKQVQNLGLEWLFRLIRQPRRWRRQLALIMFIFLIVKERLGLHK